MSAGGIKNKEDILEKYHFDYDDFVKGICKKKEIGQECNDKELETRCKQAEKRDPYRYRLGGIAFIASKRNAIKLLLLIGISVLIVLLLTGWICFIINNKMYMHY